MTSITKKAKEVVAFAMKGINDNTISSKIVSESGIQQVGPKRLLAVYIGGIVLDNPALDLPY